MKNGSRKLAVVLVLMTMTLSAGCTPLTWVAAGSLGAIGGYLTAYLNPITTTETTCYLDGVEVDCSSITGKCIGD